MTGSAHIIRGNALALPLPDASVDLICTSPPFFGLRSYTDNGEHYQGQLGSEATPAEFVAALLAATREMVRVLKPSGSIWVNLGDKYSGPMAGNGGGATLNGGKTAPIYVSGSGATPSGIRAKSLIGIPWRYALRCIDELGLILRAEIIWAKPNGLPESVTDRVRRSHEQWFHFTRSPRYFSAVDEIREEHSPVSIARSGRAYNAGDQFSVGTPNTLNPAQFVNPLGKLPGSVWTIATQPLTVPPELGVDHFAAFPMEWPRRIIQGWSPAGVCVVCGEGRRPVSDRASILEPGRRTKALGSFFDPGNVSHHPGNDPEPASGLHMVASRTIVGYACACPCPACGPGYRFGDEGCRHTPTAPTRPAVVLDPFGGTGTTSLVASVMGRTGISVDMSADYCRLAAWRTTDPGQMAAALQVERPETVSPDQLDLFSVTP